MATPRLVWNGDEIQLSQCSYCKHSVRGAPVCGAFPGSIPESILANEFDHRKPYPSVENPEDLGVRSLVSITFEPKGDHAAEEYATLIKRLGWPA